MHPKITINEKDSRIFNSRIVVPSENEIWEIKKNRGRGIKAINTLFHKFFLTGYVTIMHNNINAKISKKITESFKSCRGVLAVIPYPFPPKNKMFNGWIKKDIPITALIENISLESLSYVSCNPWTIIKTLHAKKKEIREKLSRYMIISIASIITKINYYKFILHKREKISF